MCHKQLGLKTCMLGFIVIICFFTLPATAVTTVEIASGLSASVGMDLDETNNHLYFVEYSAGTLKRIELNPSCEDASTAPCPITTITTGLSNPEDVELDLAHGLAYVTTRSAPGSGGLYKVELATGTKTLITYNLGAPQQLVLDVSNNQAYTVGYDDGRLRKIELTTGVKTTLIQGLNHPVGLALTQNKQLAYVVLQGGTDRIVRYDLIHCTMVDTLFYHTAAAPLVNPFFLAFADPTQQSLYVTERSPANRLSRVDLATRTKAVIASGLPSHPSGLVVNQFCTNVFVSTDSRIIKAELALLATEPDFLGVGHVPFTEIDPTTGLATTDVAYFFHVKNAPFGGSLNIFGNLDAFKGHGATFYRIRVRKVGQPEQVLTHSWRAYKWDASDLKFKAVTVKPEPGADYYRIPAEYPGSPSHWYPTYLMMRWPTGDNGMHEMTIELLNGSGGTITPSPAFRTMRVYIDNTPPTVTLHDIYQMVPWASVVQPCAIVESGPNAFKFKITVDDAEGFLYSYHLKALFGDNRSLSIDSDNYNNHVTASATPPSYTPIYWHGVNNAMVPSSNLSVSCNCAYTFYLSAWGRTINGYNRTQYRAYHKSITINLPGLSSCYP